MPPARSTRTFTVRRNTTRLIPIIAAGYENFNSSAFPTNIQTKIELVSAPILLTKASFPMNNSPKIDIVIPPTLTLTGPTVLTYTTNATDCWGRREDGIFNATSDVLWMGQEVYVITPGVSYIYADYVAWIPFNSIAVAQGAAIASAILTVIGTNPTTGIGIPSHRTVIGCENLANPTVPTNFNSLSIKTITAATITNDYPSWVAGQALTFDVTACVQEIINLPSWTNPGNLAVMWNGGASYRANFAAYEHSTYAPPTLVITLI
jgi:hypothetical protein